MNRSILRAGIRCLIYIFAAILIISLAVPAYSAEGGKAIAKLTSFSGTVLIKSQGSWGVEPVNGLSLYSDDKIVTKTGIATITFDDGAVIEVKANSNFLIRETETGGVSGQVGAVKRQLRLIIGKVLFKSGRGTSVNTSLETTTMVCGLRGTAGTLSIDAAGVTYLYFSEGGGDTVGNFIAGIAPDVPAEIADLNEAQRAAYVANLAAEQAKAAAEKLKSGQATDAEAQLAAAVAAKAAAQEAKAAAEAMLNNPDESIREEAKKAIAAADEAIAAADEAIQAFLDGADDQDLFGYYYGVFGDRLKRLSGTLTAQGNEFDLINLLPPPEEPEVTYNYIGGFNAEIVGATTCHSGEYSYTGGDYSSYYYYEYAEDGSAGYSYYYRSSPYYETRTEYYIDGTTYTYTYDSEVGESVEEDGTWDRATFDVSTLKDLPSEYAAQYGSNFTFREYEDETTMGSSGLALSGDLSVEGSMWGTEAMLEGVPLIAEGSITTYVPDASIWKANIYSQNRLNTSKTTYDGGAYYGYFGGIKNNSILEATLAAIGVAPDGTAGLLRAGNYLNPVAGEILSDNTFEMEGLITWDPKETISGLTAANLVDSIYSSELGSMSFTGMLGDTSFLGLEGYGGYGGYGGGNFETANITTSSESATWGIYAGYNYGDYDPTSTATSWSGHIGGGGYGGFGAYLNKDGVKTEDIGYFLADIGGTWANGKIAGGVDGDFITYTKMGTIKGDALGTYNQTDGQWEFETLGTWEGTPLSFVSDGVKRYSGYYNYSGGGSFQYTYYSDNSYGYSYSYPGGYPYTYTYYYSNGTTEVASFDGEVWSYTYGTWDRNELLANIVNVPTPPEGQTYSLSSSYTYYNNGYFHGLLGGINSLWTGSNVPVTMIGQYYDGYYGFEDSSGIWVDNLFSYNYKNDTFTTYDGGAYSGFIRGILQDKGTLIDDLEGMMIALYIDPDGNAGYLTGSMAGFGYEDIGSFKMEGIINRVDMADLGFEPADIGSHIFNMSEDLSEGGGYFIEPIGGYGFGTITLDYMATELRNFTGEDWGIFAGYGRNNSYSTEVTSDQWSVAASLYYEDDFDEDEELEREDWIEITGTQWSEGKIAGDVAGAWINYEDAKTGVSGGKLLGVFDPNNYTWDAVTAGVWIETEKFLEMASTAEGRAKLEDLNIPCVQVGVTDLEYSDSEMPLASVEMNDVEFFAYSTGATPKIWATGDVQGVTRGDPVGQGATLMNADESVSVSFTVDGYNNSVGGAWNASVNGSGTVSGHDIDIHGGAAGTVGTEYVVGATNGAFSGTAAGVAREEE